MKFLVNNAEGRVLLALIVITFGVPLAVSGYKFGWLPQLGGMRTIDIVAAAPENGGFQPSAFDVNAGETVLLRVTSPDVVHGIAIGPGEGWDFGVILPGEVREIEIAFPKAGRYTLYCNVWCSPTHWRMRAAIDVNGTPVRRAPDAIIEGLAARTVDIDAPHPVQNPPTEKPSAARGKILLEKYRATLPVDILSAEWRLSHSPADARAQLNQFDDRDAWDIVAALWLNDIPPAQMDRAETLYAKNCAACHGVNGDGEGVGADALVQQGIVGDGPSAFTDLDTMLGASSDILYGKIQRGGMGTGMPGFGPVFTREQSTQLTEYLWTFAFRTE